MANLEILIGVRSEMWYLAILNPTTESCQGFHAHLEGESPKLIDLEDLPGDSMKGWYQVALIDEKDRSKVEDAANSNWDVAPKMGDGTCDKEFVVRVLRALQSQNLVTADVANKWAVSKLENTLSYQYYSRFGGHRRLRM